MKRAEVFEIIATADKSVICRLAREVLEDSDIVVLREQTGMLMARAMDFVEGIAFNLGEVLVTEVEVRLNDTLGYSMVLGMDPGKALAGAVLDAAIVSDHHLRDKIIDVLKEERTKAEARRSKLWNAVKTTRVDFEVMS
jgi:alpha-D-ribose 1-methylphosphonate 5-triphosphate synthase subunit PhnG